MIGIFIMMLIGGIMLSLIGSLIPVYGILLTVCGIMLQMTGALILLIKIYKLGLQHLIANPNPKNILWFYIKKNKDVQLISAQRFVEGFDQSKNKPDFMLQDSKNSAYWLGGHQIRFVPEDLGFSGNHILALYASRLKKHGIEGIKDGRQKIWTEVTAENKKQQYHLQLIEHCIKIGCDPEDATRQSIETLEKFLKENTKNE